MLGITDVKRGLQCSISETATDFYFSPPSLKTTQENEREAVCSRFLQHKTNLKRSEDHCFNAYSLRGKVD
jgi:hypothetical protein